MQTLLVYNSRILGIKNAKFSGQYFYMNKSRREIFKPAIVYLQEYFFNRKATMTASSFIITLSQELTLSIFRIFKSLLLASNQFAAFLTIETKSSRKETSLTIPPMKVGKNRANNQLTLSKCRARLLKKLPERRPYKFYFCTNC